jgi:hypothetical protein
VKGYYINRRRKTNGHLFQARHKAVVLKKDRSLGKQLERITGELSNVKGRSRISLEFTMGRALRIEYPPSRAKS